MGASTRDVSTAWLGQGISLALHLALLFLGGMVFYQQAEYGVEAGDGGSAGGGGPQTLIAEVELEDPEPEPVPEPEPEVIEVPLPEPEPEPEPELEVVPEEVPVIEAVPEPVAVKPTPQKENPPPRPRPETVRARGGPENTAAASGRGGARVAVQPRYLRNPPPRYPSSARRQGQQGTVVLMVDISTSGGAESVRILRSSGFPTLDQEALRAVRGWKFQPARLGGVKVPSRARVPVVFRLD